MTASIEPVGNSYATFLAELKDRIRAAQSRAGLAVNRELVLLYWGIGQDILVRQAQHAWGAKVVTHLAHDLHQAFPDMHGWSVRNLHYMRACAEAYPDEQFVQQVVAQIPWAHNIQIIERVKDAVAREWYIYQTLQQGWSRVSLISQIQRDVYSRQGQAPTNFTQQLAPPQSVLAQQLLKDPYNFDFLTMQEAAQERDLERALLAHIREFLLELGVGFTFVGSQYRLQVGNQDFFIDLLFYHLQLRCFVVIDLKVDEFQPEFAGKMNFYLSAVDDLLRHAQDQPSIGIILCKTKDKVVAEYALRDVHKPMGVATFQVAEALPEKLQSSLPTVAELEAELEDDPAGGVPP